MFVRSRGPARDALRWAGGVLRESLSFLAAAVLFPLGFLPKRIESARPGPKPPVLLVHGFGHNASAWLLYAALLRRSGWTEVYVLNYPSWNGRIEEHARRLARKVEEIAARTPHARLDLVAHSMGGMVSRWYLQHLGGAERVRKLVTLGTPHAGIPHARYAPFHPAAAALTPGSPFMKSLGDGSKLAERTEVVSFWSRFDNMAIPCANARMPGGRRETVFEDLGHSGLLLSLTVYRELEKELERHAEDTQ
ncbi:MAG: alpha/beta fold hydrolase [Candidatus Methylomirabilis sp.]|nr:alpha/beta fold hydrolase [Deltaproteobacteria bacterium]